MPAQSAPKRPAQRKRASRPTRVYAAAGQLRLALGQKYAERHGAFKHGNFRLLWVTDFPMFEWDEAEGRWNAAHHPFTSPHENDMDKLESDPGAVRALAYDVVINGTELGSGSIRIHRQDIQAKIFKALGMSPEEQQARFGFFLEALQYGTPPHGGIALGLDRIVMILAGAESLREVIPFPKTAKAVDLMVDAPTPVSERQLKELGIAVVGKKDYLTPLGLSIIRTRRNASFAPYLWPYSNHEAGFRSHHGGHSGAALSQAEAARRRERQLRAPAGYHWSKGSAGRGRAPSYKESAISSY